MKQINTLAEFGEMIDRDNDIQIKIGESYYSYRPVNLKLNKILEDIFNGVLFAY